MAYINYLLRALLINFGEVTDPAPPAPPLAIYVANVATPPEPPLALTVPEFERVPAKANNIFFYISGVASYYCIGICTVRYTTKLARY